MHSSNLTNVERQIYVRTPLIESVALSKYGAGRKVFLKLENCQPSGSFKMRGMTNLCKQAMNEGYTELICPSGGNAGLATAYVARKLGIPCHVIVSRKSTPSICDTIRSYGATVEVFGDVWDEAYERAKQTATNSKTTFLVHPFDHEAIWEGHSSIIDELAEDLGEQVPSLIVACCGGGGLICGLVEGIRRNNWEKRTRILAMETDGTHSFNLAVKNGGQPARLEKITSIATSLAATAVCDRILQCFRESKPPILSRLVTDAEAADGCIRFLDDHRFLVGLACATSVTALYTGLVERILTNDEDVHSTIFDKCDDLSANTDGPVVVVVCGGCEATVSSIEEYRKMFNLKTNTN